MRAIHCVAYGNPEGLILVDLPEPHAGPGQVLLEVEAAGLGFVDGLVVGGAYQVKRPLPFVPGSEVAGTILAVGAGVSPDLVGQRAMALAEQGVLAERIVIDAARCTLLPAGYSSVAAASSLINYATGIYGLEDCGRLKSDETVLVLGGSGGVGMAAIDIAKGLGAVVVAAASSVEKRSACLARGADLAIDYSRPDWRQELQQALAGRPLDVVYDPVGGAWSETAFRCLGPGGRHLVVGFAGGEIPRLPLNLALLKRATLVGVDWGGHVRANPQAAQDLFGRLIELVSSGRISPAASTTHTLDQAPDVLRRLLQRQNIGKPVIVFSPHRI